MCVYVYNIFFFNKKNGLLKVYPNLGTTHGSIKLGKRDITKGNLQRHIGTAHKPITDTREKG